MDPPIKSDGLTATTGGAAVPAADLMYAIRDWERSGIDPRDLIVRLGSP